MILKVTICESKAYNMTKLEYTVANRWRWNKDENLKKFEHIYNNVAKREKEVAARKMKEEVDNSIIEAFPDVIDDILLKD